MIPLHQVQVATAARVAVVLALFLTTTAYTGAAPDPAGHDMPQPRAPEPTTAASRDVDGTGAGLIGFDTTQPGDGTGGAPIADDEDAAASHIQQEQPGDLTGIGSEATQPGLPTEDADANDEDSEDAPRPTDTVEPSPTAPPNTPTPGPSPTATLAPTSGPDGMVSRVIGPAGGELTSDRGASLTIPPDALKEDSTVTILPIADTKLPSVPEVMFVSGSAFDVSVATATGESVEQLEAPATLRIALPQEQWREGIRLYRVSGSAAEPLENFTLDEAGVSAETDQFSRFVAGLPMAVESDGRDPLPFIIGALSVLVVVLIIVGYVTAQQRRRPRAITPRSRRYR